MTSALEQAQRAGAMIYSLIIVPIEADAGRNTGGEHALIQMARRYGREVLLRGGQAGSGAGVSACVG